MQTMNISLPDSLKEYIDEKLTNDGYTSVSEYVQDLINEDRKRAAADKLDKLIQEGLDSGDSILVTPESMDEIRRMFRERVASTKR